eukprot:m.464487 g.464487  ORF g.464487 m.464487 type:complete len:266 (+) comp21619_c0_seq5:2316-3113(+)
MLSTNMQGRSQKNPATDTSADTLHADPHTPPRTRQERCTNVVPTLHHCAVGTMPCETANRRSSAWGVFARPGRNTVGVPDSAPVITDHGQNRSTATESFIAAAIVHLGNTCDAEGASAHDAWLNGDIQRASRQQLFRLLHVTITFANGVIVCLELSMPSGIFQLVRSVSTPANYHIISNIDATNRNFPNRKRLFCLLKSKFHIPCCSFRFFNRHFSRHVTSLYKILCWHFGSVFGKGTQIDGSKVRVKRETSQFEGSCRRFLWLY